jgi:sulfate adenylyltransferase subunit 1
MSGAASDAPTETTTLLRFATAGSVDDGKSTLIGRLLHDSKGLFDDQLDAVTAATKRRGDEGADLSLVTDGLKAEREQGITIDVAYRYFATPRRKFIIADTPGHAQYTRNMATGASTADLALILVDARKGLTEQSRRHACVASVLGIRSIVLCVNKMDLVEWDEEIFDEIVTEFTGFSGDLDFTAVVPIPISALLGDNVVEPSTALPWYSGPTLLKYLETVDVADPALEETSGVRFPVQLMVRADDGRRYAGTLASGVLRVGDAVTVWPSGLSSTVAGVDVLGELVDAAAAPLAMSVQLADELDVGRGDLIAAIDAPPRVGRDVTATVVWFGDAPLTPGARYLVKHTTRSTQAIVQSLEGRLDVNTLEIDPAEELAMNDVGTVRLSLADDLAYDSYAVNRTTGSFILIDPRDNVTVGAGLLA